jgi:hypothetical protein
MQSAMRRCLVASARPRHQGGSRPGRERATLEPFIPLTKERITLRLHMLLSMPQSAFLQIVDPVKRACLLVANKYFRPRLGNMHAVVASKEMVLQALFSALSASFGRTAFAAGSLSMILRKSNAETRDSVGTLFATAALTETFRMRQI